MKLEKTVIDNIKRIRKEKGISQEELAEKCHTATSYIGLMETYRNIPKLSTIEKIAEALEIDPFLLFKDSNTDEKLQKTKKITNELTNIIEKDIEKVLHNYL